jgi:hypothetical protein
MMVLPLVDTLVGLPTSATGKQQSKKADWDGLPFEAKPRQISLLRAA